MAQPTSSQPIPPNNALASATTAGSAAPSTNSNAPDAEPLISISCLDFLLIELVPLAERMARAYEDSLDYPSLANGPVSNSSGQPGQTAGDKTTNTHTSRSQSPTQGRNQQQQQHQTHTHTTSSVGVNSTTTTASTTVAPAGTVTGTATSIPLTYDGLPETEVFKDSVYFRLETLGFRVGQGMTERFARDRPRFTDPLDAIKFLCKDLWNVVFRKQIDNLKTNHRGVYVLTDNKFRPFTRMSMANNVEAVLRAQPHLHFPCGMIRGVLSSLGIKASVQAETSELPVAVFQIKTIPSKS